MWIDPLFANHLLFMATHRGSVRLEGRDFHIHGPREALVSFVPGGADAPLPRDCPAVRLAPWSGGESWMTRLEDAGFAAAETLVYMELEDAAKELAPPAGDRVTTVEDLPSAEVFARIQAAGFATGNEESDAWWSGYFLEQARRNYSHPAQCFYLGWLDGEPVTSTLVVSTPGITGIYAVATLPAYRNRGASAATLERARSDAQKAAGSRVILQALSGSYAERYYLRLGFARRYLSQVWRRVANSAR